MFSAPVKPESNTERTIRRGKSAVLVYTVLATLICLGYVAERLMSGAYESASLALMVAVPVCAVGAIAWGGLKMAETVYGRAANLKALHARLDLLEATAELLLAEAELARTVRDDALATAQDAPPIPNPPALSPEVAEPVIKIEEPGERQEVSPPASPDEVPASSPAALRATFVALLRHRDFAGALRVGDELAEKYPESGMANDYAAIRPRIEQRIAPPMTKDCHRVAANASALR